jgi:DNA-binding GntR family transcriptional regulator
VNRRRRPLLTDIVRDGLLRAIETGEFPPGAKLPNESQLSERYRVSRATVREAVRSLVEQAYLQRLHGSGTYVLPRPRLRNSLDLNFSYTQLIAASGRTPGERCLSLRREAASEAVAERLRVPVGEELMRLERVRTADGTPVMYSVDYLPGSVVGTEVPEDRLRGSIYDLLAELGRPVHHGEALVRPATVDAELAQVLECAPGELVQYLDQVDFGVGGDRLMYSREWHLPTVIELRVFRRGPGSTGRPGAVAVD